MYGPDVDQEMEMAWIGYTLMKDNIILHIRMGRPRDTWRRTVEECKLSEVTC